MSTRQEILCRLMSVMLIESIILGMGTSAVAKDLKDFLIIGGQAATWSDTLAKSGIHTEVIAKPDNDKGVVLPAYEELKKHAALMLVPFATPVKESGPDLMQFVENGGVLFWLYDGPERAKKLGADWTHKILGFDSCQISHHEPYDQKTLKEHNLRYASGKWGNTEITSKYSSVYTVFAADFFEAEPVIVDADKPERALITVRDLGKGKVIFCGAGSLEPAATYLKKLIESISAKGLPKTEANNLVPEVKGQLASGNAPATNRASRPAWPEYKGNLVSGKDDQAGTKWPSYKIMGKTMWNFLGDPWAKPENSAEMQKLKEEPMVKESGQSYWLRGSLIEKAESPPYYRLVLREMEVYEPKSKLNIAPLASAAGWASEAEIKYIERINDQDTSAQGASFSSPPKDRDWLSSKFDMQEGWFSLEFDKERLIDRAVIYAGRPRTESSNDYWYLFDHFVLQYQDNYIWKEIPGTETSNNRLFANDLSFAPLKAKAIRVYIYPQTTPAVVSTDRFKDFSPDPDKPFYIYAEAGRPPFVCLDDFSTDQASYLKWKAKHPNFMGFWGGCEWDNEFINWLIVPRGIEALKKQRASETVIKRVQREFQNPKNREQALSGLKTYYQAIRKYYFDDPDKLVFLRSAWCFDHYALEWGAGGVYLETSGTGPYRHQVSLAFVRGASRQYGKPWSWYLAIYSNGYDEKGVWSGDNVANYLNRGYGRADYGMSPSLNKRDRYLAYLSGANAVHSESWPQAYCQDIDNDGAWELSPHGEALKEWHAFTKRNPEIGLSYAPVALLLPFSHGQPHWGGNPWTILPQERYDHMIDAFMYTIVPPDNDFKKGQEGCLFNSPYGDIYDVLLPNPPSGPIPLKTLNNYKVAILLSQHAIDKPLAERLMEYVEEGGTLCLNIKQVNEYFPVSFLGAKPTAKVFPVEGQLKSLMDNETFALPENYEYEYVELDQAKPVLMDGKNNVLACVNKYGKGHLVLTTADYLIPKDNLASISQQGKELPFVAFLLKHVVKEALPLEIKGDIEYGLNKLEDGWLLYLINNKGVVKYTKSPQRLDPKATARVEVMLKNIKAGEVTELREARQIIPDETKNSFFVDVGPGDIRIVKIKPKR